jgi:cobalt-zinc-cadmium efflux system outer membrane protein
LGWEITSLITHGARKEAATAHADAVDLDGAWLEWRAAAATRTAAVRLAGAEQRLALTEEIDRTLSDHAALMHRAGAAGIITRLDESITAASASDAHAATLDLRHECVALRLQLGRLLGFPPGRHVGVRVASWPTRLVIPPGLADGLANERLDLLALQRGYDSQDALVRAAILAQFPKISLGFTSARDTGAVSTLNLGVTIDLPLFDRNQGVIANEVATRQQLFDEYAQRLFEARHDLALALAEAEATAEKIAQLDEAITASDPEAALVAKAAAAGQMDLLTAQAVTARITQKRAEAVSSRQHLAELRIAIELAVGHMLDIPRSPAVAPRTGE